MKLTLIILALARAALYVAWAAPSQYESISVNYHESYGIPEAARIKAAEMASDFDGARIVGGSPADIGQYPHLAGLVILLTSGATSVCGASLLSNTKLVTAAVCWFDGVNGGSEITVVLGSTHLFSGGLRVITNQVVIHSNYNYRTLNNNVAMVTVPWTTYTVNISPISFAHGSNQFVGQAASASGYGRTADGAAILPDQSVRHVSMTVMTNAECQRTFGSVITTSTLCTDTAAGGGSICGGDTGGPLQVGDTLVGISSFVAAAGCSQGLPAGFARVTSFATWIHLRL